MSAQAVRTTILLAEDDPDVIWQIKRLMDGFSPAFQLQVVSDGESAIGYLNGEAPYADRSLHPVPALVLLDINLPRLDGIGVLRWIRQHPRLTGLIVVMLTGSESHEHLSAAYDLHVNSFLRKSPLLSMPDVSKNVLSYWLQLNQAPPHKPG
jgi:CheY-like chemotaxis protein